MSAMAGVSALRCSSPYARAPRGPPSTCWRPQARTWAGRTRMASPPYIWLHWTITRSWSGRWAARTARRSMRKTDGETPLHCAAINGQTAAARALLELGADASLRKDGRTALVLAEGWGKHETARTLHNPPDLLPSGHARRCGLADTALPPGTRLRVDPRGDGTYARFEKKTFGPNAHFVRFDGTEAEQPVRLKASRRSVLAARRPRSRCFRRARTISIRRRRSSQPPPRPRRRHSSSCSRPGSRRPPRKRRGYGQPPASPAWCLRRSGPQRGQRRRRCSASLQRSLGWSSLRTSRTRTG